MSRLLNGQMIITPGGDFGVPGATWRFGKHMGVDLRAAVGTEFFAPYDGIVNERYVGSKNVKVLGVEMAGFWWRFLHIDNWDVVNGQRFKAGQRLGWTGNSGEVAAHLHVDVRKIGTVWSSSFDNYINPLTLLKEQDEMIANTEQADKMYKLLRPNGGATPSEILGTAGRRTYVEFVTSAQSEVAIRDSNIRNMQKQIDDLTNVMRTKDQALDTMRVELETTKLKLKNVADDKDKHIIALSDELNLAKKTIQDLTNPTQKPIEGKPQLAPKPAEPKPAEQPTKPSVLTKFILMMLRLRKA